MVGCTPAWEAGPWGRGPRGGRGAVIVAMTAAVKDELSRLAVSKTCCRRSEVSSLLRFAGGLQIVGGRVVVEAERDTGAAARRLRKEIHDLYGHSADIHVLASGGLRKGTRYVVRGVDGGDGGGRGS